MNPKTTHELQRDVEASNRKFRLSFFVFVLMVVIGLAVVILLQSRTLAKVEAQLDQQRRLLTAQNELLHAQKTNTDDLKTSTQEQFQAQREFELCLVDFFGRPDRDSLIISDICQIDEVPGQGVDFEPSGAGPQNGSDGVGQLQVEPAEPAQTIVVERPTPSPGPGSPPPSTPPASPPASPPSEPGLIRLCLLQDLICL